MAAAAALITAALAAGSGVATASTPQAAPEVSPTQASTPGVLVTAPEVFGGFTDNLPFSNNVQVTKMLPVPTGTYTAFAKVTATTTSNIAEVMCRLHTTAAGDADESRLTLSSSTPTQTMSLQFNFVNNLNQTVVALTCQRNATANVTLSWMKIVAIRVADPSHLHNSPLV
ncbi:MAG TPA: hypothetical protein VFC19_45455 [Candidatus Limnocylindrales bacterium]|nr:hypothetical protein [Candidatus Limnocylindrales bacterium]